MQAVAAARGAARRGARPNARGPPAFRSHYGAIEGRSSHAVQATSSLPAGHAGRRTGTPLSGSAPAPGPPQGPAGRGAPSKRRAAGARAPRRVHRCPPRGARSRGASPRRARGVGRSPERASRRVARSVRSEEARRLRTAPPATAARVPWSPKDAGASRAGAFQVQGAVRTVSTGAARRGQGRARTDRRTTSKRPALGAARAQKPPISPAIPPGPPVPIRPPLIACTRAESSAAAGSMRLAVARGVRRPTARAPRPAPRDGASSHAGGGPPRLRRGLEPATIRSCCDACGPADAAPSRLSRQSKDEPKRSRSGCPSAALRSAPTKSETPALSNSASACALAPGPFQQKACRRHRAIVCRCDPCWGAAAGDEASDITATRPSSDWVGMVAARGLERGVDTQNVNVHTRKSWRSRKCSWAHPDRGTTRRLDSSSAPRERGSSTARTSFEVRRAARAKG